MSRCQMALLAALIFCTGCTQESSPPPATPTVDSEPPTSGIEAPVDAPVDRAATAQLPGEDAPVHRVSAEEFHAALDASDLAKYRDGWIEVTGILTLFTADLEAKGGPVLVLTIAPPGDELKAAFKSVSCNMAANEQPWKQAQLKSQVTIRGVLGTAYDSPRLVQGKIINAKGEPTPQFTVDELETKLKDDFESIAKEFSLDANKTVVVSGKFAGAITPDDAEEKQWWVALDGKDGQRIHAFAGINGMPEFRKLKPGQEATILGTLIILSKDKPESVNLEQAVNLTPFTTEAPSP